MREEGLGGRRRGRRRGKMLFQIPDPRFPKLSESLKSRLKNGKIVKHCGTHNVTHIRKESHITTTTTTTNVRWDHEASEMDWQVKTLV